MTKIILPLKNLNIKPYPQGSLMQPYGVNCQFYTPNFWNEATQTGFKCHNGQDYFTFVNDEVLAVCDGTILDAGLKPQRGNGIWLISEPYIGTDGKKRADMFCFFHMNTLCVKTGDKVKQGQVIGYEGNTGVVMSGSNVYWNNAPTSTGTHLHFGHYPLVEGTDDKLKAYWINTEPFVLEYKNNYEDGAVDPMEIIKQSQLKLSDVQIQDNIKQQITLYQRIVALLVAFVNKIQKYGNTQKIG